MFITLLRRRNVTAVWWFRLWRRFVCRMWTEALNISFLWVLIMAYAGRFCTKGVSFLGFRNIKGVGISLQTTRGARNPNLQVFIKHASHVWSQHSFGPPLRMNGMHRMYFDHACLDFLSLIIWSRVFWPTVMWNLRKAWRWSKSVFRSFDLWALSPALRNLWLLLIIIIIIAFYRSWRPRKKRHVQGEKSVGSAKKENWLFLNRPVLGSFRLKK